MRYEQKGIVLKLACLTFFDARVILKKIFRNRIAT